jgi:hypothetical protein
VICADELGRAERAVVAVLATGIAARGADTLRAGAVVRVVRAIGVVGVVVRWAVSDVGLRATDSRAPTGAASDVPLMHNATKIANNFLIPNTIVAKFNKLGQ